MADQTAELKFILEAEDKSGAAFDSVAKKTDGLKGKIEGMAPAFKGMAVAGGLALGAIGALATKAIGDYAEAEVSAKKLEHAVIAVSKGTQQQVEEINKLTQALEKKGVVDADSLKSGVAQLSTFGLSTKMVLALTPALADLTVNQAGVNATTQDFEASANTMAKALNGQFGVLEKSGIRFTEAQQKLIQFGTETQRIAALQEGFAQNLKFTNETAAHTAAGGMAKLQVQIGNISENIGAALLPALTMLMEKITPVIEKIVAWTEQNPKLTMYILAGVAALAALVAIVGTLGLALPAIIGGVSALSTAFMFLAGNPIVLTIAAIAGVVAIVWKAVEAYKALRGEQDGLRQSAMAAMEVYNKTAIAIDKMTDPVKRARLEKMNAELKEAADTATRAANAGFFKQIGVGLGLTKYDVGGMVPGPRGAPQLAIVHGGEYVNTAEEVSNARRNANRTEGGAWGHTFNFVFNGDINDKDTLVKRIKDALNQDLNNKIAVPQ